MHSAAMKDEGNTNYRNGNAIAKYSREFRHIRNDVLTRDQRCCLVCKMTEADNGQELDVHHIDFDKNNNVIENFASLCKMCHSTRNGKPERRMRFANELYALLSDLYGYQKRCSISVSGRIIITSPTGS